MPPITGLCVHGGRLYKGHDRDLDVFGAGAGYRLCRVMTSSMYFDTYSPDKTTNGNMKQLMLIYACILNANTVPM
jgi:hypothetical protein